MKQQLKNTIPGIRRKWAGPYRRKNNTDFVWYGFRQSQQAEQVLRTIMISKGSAYTFCPSSTTWLALYRARKHRLVNYHTIQIHSIMIESRPFMNHPYSKAAFSNCILLCTCTNGSTSNRSQISITLECSPSLLHSSTHYPHRPSFQPSFHLSLQKLQSNSSFPSFTLTALCALHIQRPNFSWLFTASAGSFSGSAIQSWKSSAQTQQGYSCEKSVRKVRVFVWCAGVGVVG